MSGIGISHGCVSVVNGIFTGTGAAMGIDLVTEAVFEEKGGEQYVRIIGTETDDALARICAARTLERIGRNPHTGYHLTIKSEIPPSRGLKSSSSVCNAIVKAVTDAYDVEMDIMDTVRLGVQCAREAKVTVTGSFDDACGCEFGGFVMTDNRNDIILKKKPIGKYDVLIHVPEYTKRAVPEEAYRAIAPKIGNILETAETDMFRALTLNGESVAEATGEKTDIAKTALENGALAAGLSGTGPAVAVIAESGKGRELAEKLPYPVIVTETR